MTESVNLARMRSARHRWSFSIKRVFFFQPAARDTSVETPFKAWNITILYRVLRGVQLTIGFLPKIVLK